MIKLKWGFLFSFLKPWPETFFWVRISNKSFYWKLIWGTRLKQKQPSRAVLRKRYLENMQQICRTIPMPKCNFDEVAKVFWKYAAKLQENTYAEVRFQLSCKATLLKTHFGMVFSCKFAAYFQNTFS